MTLMTENQELNITSNELYIAFMRKGRRKFLSVNRLYVDDVDIDDSENIYLIKFDERLQSIKKKIIDYMALRVDLEVSLGGDRENCLLHYTPVKVMISPENKIMIVDTFEVGI